MATKNTLQKRSGKESISTFCATPAVRQKINEIIGGKKGDQFIASMVTSVSQNPQLSECDYSTVLSAALTGAALNLSPSPQLGQFYMVPFNDNKNGRKVAQFQLGYKGYIQLAIRSGQYRDIDVISVKDGELISYNPFTHEIQLKEIEDPLAREQAETIGYFAFFELLNGFRKQLYWSKEKMQAHAQKYSQGYAADLRKKTKYTFWSKDFDGMAQKTMLRQLISKWGIMSVEFQTALERDMGVINTDETVDYIDNQDVDVYDVTPTNPNPTNTIPEPETNPDEDRMIDEMAAQQNFESAFFG